MEDKIEQIVSNIEESFNKLNTAVEQLQKAEKIASSSVDTTSTLITEFKTSIESIEKLVKVDFANEYNNLAGLNNQLLEKINKIDFDNKFHSVEQKVVDKNFDTKFSELSTAVTNINFDNKFQSVEQKIIDKNFDTKFSELNTVVANINFDNKFQAVEDNLGNQMKEIRHLKTLMYIVFALIIICAISTIFSHG
ncbi:hypothetical protein [Arcicella rigui]|uniref:Uncharacterized protein n=1 Tax=Arcicella rigui TaxID=797020 RepID=A0ABU5Q892_9BACT|nr:hypothetical protein [Arcicella rigui]MEA5139066.1 hypothetical protein [Arcicella rigui]